MKLWIQDRPAISTAVAAVAIVLIIVVAGGLSAAILLAPTTQSSSTISSTKSSLTSSSLPTTSSTSSSITSSAVATSTPLTKVNFLLDFLPAGEHAWFYYGVDHGIYASNGIDLNIMPGTGSGAAVAAIAAGKADFVLADTGTFIAASTRQNLSNVKIVANVFPVSVHSALYNAGVIHSVKDLNNKTAASFQGSGTNFVFPIFAKLNGVNASSIKFTYASPATFVQLVALGKVDFIIGAIDDLSFVDAVAAQNHIQLGLFLFAKYGLTFYGHSILTTTQMIQTHPDLVRKFVNATMYSIYRAVQTPQATTDSFLKYNPTQDKTSVLEDVQVYIQNIFPNVTASSKPLTLGWIDPQKMQYTINTIGLAYNVGNLPQASTLYTDDYVQKPTP